MRVAITGGTGFVGGHLARALARDGHEAVLVARGVDRRDTSLLGLPGASVLHASVSDEEAMAEGFAGCDAVAHCAGINREIGSQRYESVHVEGTRAVVSAAKRAGVRRIALLSYLRARPGCGSGYLESKWAAEEIVRGSGLEHLVVKAGVIYGRGDHLIDHTSRSIGTLHVFGTVGLRDRVVRPVAVEDVVRILQAGLVEGRLAHATVAVVGPEELPFGEIARRIARAMHARALILPAPIWFLHVLAWLSERTMTVPLVSSAQVRLLDEGSRFLDGVDEPPADLRPATRLGHDTIAAALPHPARFRAEDFRWFNKRSGP